MVDSVVEENGCPRCGGKKWFSIPDSLARACDSCGFVHVLGEPAASIQEWARDLHEASKKHDKGRGFLRLPVRLMPKIVEYLESIGEEEAAINAQSFSTQYVDPDENSSRRDILDSAREQVAKDGEIEFDDDAAVSSSDSGAYVMGWVWVDLPDEEDDEDNDDT